MPVFTGAVPQLVSEYETRQYRYGISSSGGLLVLGKRQYRSTKYREYEVGFSGDGPQAQQQSTPSGWTFEGWEERIRTQIPRVGVHLDRFSVKSNTWVDDE